LNWTNTTLAFKTWATLGSLEEGEKWFGLCLADANLADVTDPNSNLRYGFWLRNGRVYVMHRGDVVAELREVSASDKFEVVSRGHFIDYVWNNQLIKDFEVPEKEMLQVFAHIKDEAASITTIEVDFGGSLYTFNLAETEELATNPFIEFESLGKLTFNEHTKLVMIPGAHLNHVLLGNTPLSEINRRLQLETDVDAGEITGVSIVDFPAFNFKGNPSFSSFTLTSGGQGIYLHKPIGSIVTLASAFDNCPEDRNTPFHYVQEVLYDQNGVAWSATKTYKNGLGQREQSLVKSYTHDFYVAQQGVEDRMGIQTLQTLPAPTYDEHGCYQAQFIQRVNGQPYTHNQFDQPTTDSDYRSAPESVHNTTKGSVGWYYSNNNNEESHVAASGYPFAVTDYYFEPTLRLKQAGLQGDDHQFGGHTNQVYHLGHAGELEYMYGSGKHYMQGTRGPIYAKKTLTVDVNGLERVTYTDEVGRTIASCYSGLGECNHQNL